VGVADRAGKPDPEWQYDVCEPCSEGEEAQQPKQLRDPGQPTQAERDEHESHGHVAYRTWCQHCVAARGRGQAHKPSPEGEG
jgi:hypothetical protein